MSPRVCWVLVGSLGLVARLAELAGWLGLAGALLLFLSGVVFAGISAGEGDGCSRYTRIVFIHYNSFSVREKR